MKRLLAFGCSFTNYRWSTWADCLAPEFDLFENWGQSGAGNHYIFNSVMEADQRQRFDVDDTVVVCWTGNMRDDWYVNQRWQTLGNMYTCPIYDPEYLKTQVDQRGYTIRDLAFVKAVKTLLESRGCRWQFLSMCDWTIDQDAREVYQDVIAAIAPSYQSVLFAQGWPDRSGDPHPSPEEHLSYLDSVLPGWVTKSSTRVKIHEESINVKKQPHRSGLSTVKRL